MLFCQTQKNGLVLIGQCAISRLNNHLNMVIVIGCIHFDLTITMGAKHNFVFVTIYDRIIIRVRRMLNAEKYNIYTRIHSQFALQT